MELNSRANIIAKMQGRVLGIDEFNWDHMMAPPLYSLITQDACNQIAKIATSVKYSGNARKRYELIDNILTQFGFEKKGAGTNRVVYKYLENTNFLLKVATDDVGIHDNPKEFQNQFIYKPFVTKVYEVDPTGAVALVERVVPITSREEFMTCAGEIYDVIRKWFLGDNIMADIGTNFFMNWGIRPGFGPVLLDYPYVYELDGNKLFCNEHINGVLCGGEIDYDDGYNFLYCTKCHKKYRVRELAKATENKHIVKKGRATKMQVVIKRGNNVIKTTGGEGPVKEETPVIQKTETINKSNETGTFTVSVGYKPVQDKRRNPNYKGNSNKNSRNTSLRQVDHKNGINNRGIVRASDNDSNFRKEEKHDNSALYDDINKFKAKASKLAEENTILNETIHKLEVNNSSIEKELAETKADLEQAYKDFDEIEAKYHSVKDELKTAKADLESAEKLTSSADDKGMEIESLRQELEVAHNQIKDLEEKLASNNTNNDAELAMKNLQETTDKLNECRDDLDAKDDEIDAKNKEIAELRKKLEDASKNAEDKVKLPINPNDFTNEDTNYVDCVMNADGIAPFIGELTTINALNLESGAALTDNDQYVIVITTSDGEALTDQDGNKICIYCVNNIHVDELFCNDRLINETANRVKLLNVNKGE